MAVPPPPDPALLDANLAAMAERRPRVAETLRAAEPPPSAKYVAGRDGTPTFAWTDDHGKLCWLGRTSMPELRTDALIDAFDPGSGNVLLAPLGQGAVARRLLQRMAPHQAVMAIEPDAWSFKLCLSLCDWTKDLRNGRLLPFIGPHAWEALRDFLIEHGGYLTPERVLAWPWFSTADVAQLTSRLTSVSSDVATQRAAKQAQRSHTTRKPPETRREPGVAIVSNVPDARIRRFADHLEAAARTLDIACHRFVLDHPAVVHPGAIENALARTRLAVLILLDITPDALQFELPRVPWVIATTHPFPLTSDWIHRIPETARLSVMTDLQRTKAIEEGFDPSRLILSPPAATADLQEAVGAPGSGILVVADGHDTSAEAVGLHLSSHRKLWETAAGVIADRIDTYQDGQADAVLLQAERHLKIELRHDEVRNGLVERIRQILAPTLLVQAYARAMLDAGLDFELYGRWQVESPLAEQIRGPWPGPTELPAILAGHGRIITFDPSGSIQPALLDGIAAGLVAFVRAHPSDETPWGLSAVLDPREHVVRFQSRRELIARLRDFEGSPQPFRGRAAMAARHVNTRHTWSTRLSALLHACERD